MVNFTNRRRIGLTGFLLISLSFVGNTQESVARIWNEVLLESVRNDAARPTIHARNLFHHSVVSWDAWAAYDENAQTVLLGNTLGDFFCPFDGIIRPEDPQLLQEAREEAISYAMYRLLRFRFQNSPGVIESYQLYDITMEDLGYDTGITSTDYSDGDPAKLGNYIAAKMIEFGLQDGSNEALGFSNQYYLPVNPDLVMVGHGNPDIVDPNRWQPLELEGFIDQGGNPFPTVPPFLSPEWGNVTPFSLREEDKTTLIRDGEEWNIYGNPGAPPHIDTTETIGLESAYKFGFILVALWQGHHDPADGVMLDVSPASIGNLTFDQYPTNHNDYPNFYNLYEGGDISQGRALNPVTGLPYEPQIVPRADYARILAEFWADGPDSESPPGHWFTIMNYVSDQPQFEKRWNGEGEILDDLEWDVRAYLTMGGAMHDAAITCWSLKGYYDFIRPVSAIRFMAEKGQCSDPELPHFHPAGFPLIPGKIELVTEGDPLAGPNNEYLNEIKIFTWRGPLYINDIETEYAGVDWILAKDWWPYQRPSFVTPPFAAYVSGHSTYSRCAAEIMTLITGDEFFPGGMGEFHCPQNEFLVFEDGPSMDVTLQWATYRDASDQCSLSRIWGGIHPPCDDMPGRLLGAELGPQAHSYAESFFDPGIPKITSVVPAVTMINDPALGSDFTITITYNENMNTSVNPEISFPSENPLGNTLEPNSGNWVSQTVFVMHYDLTDANVTLTDIDVRVDGAEDLDGLVQKTYLFNESFEVDTQNPSATSNISNLVSVNDDDAGVETLILTINYDQNMDVNSQPVAIFNGDPGASLSLNEGLSSWLDNQTYEMAFDIIDANTQAFDIDVYTVDAKDENGNPEMPVLYQNLFSVDTENPTVTIVSPVVNLISDLHVGSEGFQIMVIFSEVMDMNAQPDLSLVPAAADASLAYNVDASLWLDGNTFMAVYDVEDVNADLAQIDVLVANAMDFSGNDLAESNTLNLFDIDTKNPELISLTANTYSLTEAEVGDEAFEILLIFDDAMNWDFVPVIEFPEFGAFDFTLSLNNVFSGWINETTYKGVFDLVDSNFNLENADISISDFVDDAGNSNDGILEADVFDIMLDPDNISENAFALFTVYPNPLVSGENLIVESGTYQGKLRLEVFANNGSIVKTLDIAYHSGNLQLSTENLSNGIYVLRISNEQSSSVFRFQIAD